MGFRYCNRIAGGLLISYLTRYNFEDLFNPETRPFARFFSTSVRRQSSCDSGFLWRAWHFRTAGACCSVAGAWARAARGRGLKRARRRLAQGAWQDALARVRKLRNLGRPSASWKKRLNEAEAECLRRRAGCPGGQEVRGGPGLFAAGGPTSWRARGCCQDPRPVRHARGGAPSLRADDAGR